MRTELGQLNPDTCAIGVMHINIRRVMREKHISYAELARRMKLSPSTVRRQLNNVGLSPCSIRRMPELLGVPADKIFEGIPAGQLNVRRNAGDAG